MTLVSEENINIRYSEIDFNKNLKMFALLNFFQDIASESAENLGFGYSHITPQNLMWVLLKYRIEFNPYPKNINLLTVRTEPRGYNRIFAYRNFEVLSNDTPIVQASSIWGLVDINTMNMVNIENAINSPNMKIYQPGEKDLKFDKIPPITKVDFEDTFKVRYNDIDVNMHANNANYIVWALEPLDYNFKKDHHLKSVDMLFKKEIKYGETLVSQIQMIDDTTSLHILRNAETNEDACLLKCTWINSNK